MPPLASVIIITASDSGVTLTCPWPIATEIVSPGYHCCLRTACFHSDEGMSPGSSFGRSMPLISAEAERRRPLVDPVDAEHLAERVEVHVAGLLDGVAHVDRCRARPCLWHMKVRVRRRTRRRVQLTRKSGVATPSSSAAVATTILKVDPGE